MTNLDKPVVRRTPYVRKGRPIIVTISPGGIALRPERTQQSVRIDWETLYRWLETAQVYIPPRR